MREYVSRLALGCLEKHTPAIVRSLEAQILLKLASVSFQRPGKKIWHLAPDKALSLYAEYTVECMTHTRISPRRLYRGAYRLGERIRHLTGFTKPEDLQRLVFYLYKNIRISMHGSLPGEIQVPACFFRSFYTPGQCRIMSNVDWGIIAGLYGGGSLEFTKRLTEGCDRCQAKFCRGETC